MFRWLNSVVERNKNMKQFLIEFTGAGLFLTICLIAYILL